MVRLVIAVMDDVLVRVDLGVWFGQEVRERVELVGLLLLVRVVGEVHDRLPVLRRKYHRLRILLLN